MNRGSTAAQFLTRPTVFSSLYQRAAFSTNNNDNKTDKDKAQELFQNAEKKMLENEAKIRESLSEKERQYYSAYRLAILKHMDDAIADKTNWWNKVKEMTPEQLEELPNEYIRKFGSFIQKIEEAQQESHLEDNIDNYNMYNQVKNLDKLITNEERLAAE